MLPVKFPMVSSGLVYIGFHAQFLVLASMLNSIVSQAVNAAMENAIYPQPVAAEIGVVGTRAFPEGNKRASWRQLPG